MNTSTKIARELVNRATTDGGCTVDRDGNTIEAGTPVFVVGLGGAQPLSPYRSFIDQAETIVDDALWDFRTDALGSWLDNDTGDVYIEPVQLFTCKRLACEVAAGRGELAIYDLTNSQEIRIEK